MEASVLEDFLENSLPLNACDTKFFLFLVCDFFISFLAAFLVTRLFDLATFGGGWDTIVVEREVSGLCLLFTFCLDLI